MKLVFAGTPVFAEVVLAHLLAAGHEVLMVLTQPDRPAGRGLKLQPSPVKALALAHGLPVYQPRSLRLDGVWAAEAALAQQALLAAQPEVMVVAAYGLLLPTWVLGLPARGCLNVHASLLPRWRGAAPIQRAIEAGDELTGITIMQMDAGLDTGAMLASEAVGMARMETSGSLHDKLAPMGGALMVRVLAQLSAFEPQVQDEALVCYAAKLSKAQSEVDWRESALQIERRVRALDPAPGAWCRWGDSSLKLWGAALGPLAHTGVPGQVLAVSSHEGILVACGQGSLWLTQLQRAGGKRLGAEAFLAGTPIEVGQWLVGPT